MASYPLPFVSYVPNTERFTLDRRQQGMESNFTYAFKVVHGASRWALEWSWPRMSVPRAEIISAWGLSLRGMEGTFLYAPNQTIRSTLTGRSLAATGFPYQRAIQVGGWSAGALSTLRLGQWFTIGRQLLRITEAGAVADASGRVTIAVEPELRVTYAAGTPVEFVKPTGMFRFADARGLAYTLDTDKRPDFGTINAIEAFA